MTMPALDPELLQAFVAVAERRSFTRAAEHLNRTQAAISLQVKRLEERLGVVLFHRSTARVDVTAAAEGFLIDARRILDLGEHAVARLARQAMAGRVRIGVMEDYGTRLLPRLLAGVAEQFPLIQVEMEIGLTTPMLKRLGSAFDLVIAMHGEGANDGELICREEALWIGAADRAVEEGAPLPVALSVQGCLFREWATAALQDAGRPWRLAYVSSSVAAVEALVRQGLAVTVVKRSMLAPGLRVIAPGEHVPALPGAEIRLHRAASLDPVAARVAEHLAQGLRSRQAGFGTV